MQAGAGNVRMARGLALILLLLVGLGGSAAAQPGSGDEALVDALRQARDGVCEPAQAAWTSVEPRWRGLLGLHLARCLLAKGAWPQVEALGLAWLDGLDDGAARAVPWATDVLARVELHGGRPAAAAQRLDRALRSAADARVSRERRARWQALRMLAAEVQGETSMAARLRREVLVEHPAAAVAVRLVVLGPAVEMTNGAWLDAGLAALAGRNYEEATRCLRAAACDGLPVCSARSAARSRDPARREAAWQMGWLLYRYRRELAAEGLVWLQAVVDSPGHPRRDEALLTVGRALQRMGRVEEGTRAWRRLLADAQTGSHAGEAWLSMVHLAMLERDWTTAASWAAEALRTPLSDQERAQLHRWWAWNLFRAGECEGALRAWEQGPSTPDDRLHAAYWRGWCLPEPAREAGWRQLVEDAPLHWYGLLAARALDLPPPRLDPAPLPAVRNGLPARLAAASFYGEARWVDDELQWSREEGERMMVRNEATDWRRWRREGRALEPRRWPRDAGDREGWRWQYPAFFHASVAEASRTHGVPQGLLQAILRRESLYDPWAISVSDAMGLMQVIPQTALAIARIRDRGYADGDLFEPRRALDDGAWYLSALLQKYEGQLALAAAAYNAGPVAADEWVRRHGGDPLDRFVETIPFDQARHYVRSVVPWMIAIEVAWGVEDPDAAGAGWDRWLPAHVVPQPGVGVDF
jgi:soluble lytic murein transglycosylase